MLGFRETIFIATLCSSQMLSQANLASGIIPVHIIGDSFGTTQAAQLSWFPAAFSLTVGTFIFPCGRLGDLYGHKKIAVMGWLWLALWSVIAGFSVYSGTILFDVCRAMQGIGSAMTLPASIAIIGVYFPPGPKQHMIFSAFGAAAPNGFLLGGTISGLFSQLVWWPWSYWVLGMICAMYALLAILFIPDLHEHDMEKRSHSFEELDLLGAATGITGMVLVNFAWNQAPSVGWQTPYVYVLLIVGILFLGAFGVVEARARYPLVPMKYFTREVGFTLACMACGWSSFSIWLYYLSQMEEVLRGHSPLLTTAHFSPVGISGIGAAFATGLLLPRIGPGYVMLISMTAFTIGPILMSTSAVQSTYWAQTFVSTVIMPWGMDLSFPSAAIILSNALPREVQGVAASLLNTVVNYSISLALGFAGTVESQLNNGGTTEPDLLTGYRSVFYLGIGFGALGWLVAVAFVMTTPSNKGPVVSEDDSTVDEKGTFEGELQKQ